MSQFLGFESFKIPLGASPADVLTTLKAAVTSRGWRVVHDSTPMQIVTILGDMGNATYPIANAFNNNIALPVITTGAGSTAKWVGAQLATATSIRTVELGQYINYPTEAPKTWTVDFSDNGTSWTTAFTQALEPAWASSPAGERRFYSIPDSGAHVYWRVRVTASQAAGSGDLTIGTVNFYDANMNVASPTVFMHIIPPAGTTTGSAVSRDLLRVVITGTTISFIPIQQTLTGVTQTVAIAAGTTGGTLSNSITLGGVTVAQDPTTLAAGNTAAQNLRFLYENLRRSTDPIIMDYNWEYTTPATQNGSTSTNADKAHIYGTCKTSNTRRTLTGSNVSIIFASPTVPVNAWTPADSQSVGGTINIDLINGFIYYLQVNARGIALATKTITNFYGPIHACYVENNKALEAIPPNTNATIIELYVGSDAVSTNLSASAYTSHVWSISDNAGIGFQPASGITGVFNNVLRRHKLEDAWSNTYVSNGTYAVNAITLESSNIWVATEAVGNDFQVHRLSTTGAVTIESRTAGTSTSVNATYLAPAADIQDWFKFVGTATNESLHLIADTVTTTTLVGNIQHTDTPTTITLADASKYNAGGGFIALGEEFFQYTGIVGNQLTGVTRAKYASTPKSHFTGDLVYQAMWFTVINGGALLCGFQSPA